VAYEAAGRGFLTQGSHAIYVSQPEAVAALVEQAAKSVKTSAVA
jgi:hypothetical protein